MDPGQTSGLFRFIAANGVGPADTVIVEHGAAPMEQSRAEALVASLSITGLHASAVVDAALTPGVARVVIERYVAIAPDCPDWSAPPGPNFGNYDQRNFGCADAKNLAAMVADPKDLAMGATMSGQAGDPVTRPVYSYRAGRRSPIASGATGGAGAGATAAGAGVGSPGMGAAGGAPTGPQSGGGGP